MGCMKRILAFVFWLTMIIRILWILNVLFWTVSTSAIRNNGNDNNDDIIFMHQKIEKDGSYHYRFLTENGIFKYEYGKIVNSGQPNEHIVVEGGYSYKDSDGKQVTIRYIADENGFRVITKPDKLPTPLPDPILAALPPHVVATLIG